MDPGGVPGSPYELIRHRVSAGRRASDDHPLIADTKNGRLYVGKADGSDRILGRWSHYAKDAHGGNVALKELAIDPSHRQHLQFSILRVFGPSVPTSEVDAAEAHYKRAMLTRTFGLNRN